MQSSAFWPDSKRQPVFPNSTNSVEYIPYISVLIRNLFEVNSIGYSQSSFYVLYKGLFAEAPCNHDVLPIRRPL